MSIPVIDVFAGPGGLGEGFSSLENEDGESVFEIALSVEMDKRAHETLLLRTFFRQFDKNDRVPKAYYEFLRMKGYVNVEKLRSLLEKEGDKEALKKYDKAAKIAKQEELGQVDEKKLDNWIVKALEDENGVKKDNWVLVGGPPCQAYSLVGRSRNGGINPNDPRATLYREYYRILAVHNPPLFVMENVKGLLSAKVEESPIFERILSDIRDPVEAYSKLNGRVTNISDCPGYHIYSFISEPRVNNDKVFESESPNFKHTDFVIKSEEYGLPQARHRVILLGVRKDLETIKPGILETKPAVFVKNIIDGLPPVRSGLSKKKDTPENWTEEILKLKADKKIEEANENCFEFPLPGILEKSHYKKWIRRAFQAKTYFVLKSVGELYPEVEKNMSETIEEIQKNKLKSRGGEFVEGKCSINTGNKKLQKWFLDKRIGGACNHTARGHMGTDLHRYLFVSSFGDVNGKSPKLEDFPEELLPNHVNAYEGVRKSKFADRFRVQLWNEQAKTITSHISKDGHYYIHPDSKQCRSLTVREAARLQTFPDNYFFCGPRTSQYIQVGNAVPPLLAHQIAKLISDLFRDINYAESSGEIKENI